MLKIGVISDTHKKSNRAKKAIDFLISEDVSCIIHAGDIGTVETLEYLHSSGIDYKAVFGNNDSILYEYADKFGIDMEPSYFKIDNVAFKLMHHPFYLTPDSDVVIFGHTHYFEADVKNGKLFINSGEVCARNKPISECAVVEISSERFVVYRAQREIGSEKFEVKRLEFER
jgi:putative phosphoesterase